MLHSNSRSFLDNKLNRMLHSSLYPEWCVMFCGTCTCTACADLHASTLSPSVPFNSVCAHVHVYIYPACLGSLISANAVSPLSLQGGTCTYMYMYTVGVHVHVCNDLHIHVLVCDVYITQMYNGTCTPLCYVRCMCTYMC